MCGEVGVEVTEKERARYCAKQWLERETKLQCAFEKLPYPVCSSSHFDNPRTGFLNISTIDIWGQVILYQQEGGLSSILQDI